MDKSIFAGSRKHLWYEEDTDRRRYKKIYYSVFACNDTLLEDQPSKSMSLDNWFKNSLEFLELLSITQYVNISPELIKIFILFI